MALSRRNVVIGLGAVAAGGGVLAGTGAFTQVEAQRQVSLEVVADNVALVGLDPTSDFASLENGAIELDFADINPHATTTIEETFTVTNNSGSDFWITIEDVTLGTQTIEFKAHSDDTDQGDHHHLDPGAGEAQVQPGASFRVVVELVTTGTEDPPNVDTTILATDSDQATGNVALVASA